MLTSVLGLIFPLRV